VNIPKMCDEINNFDAKQIESIRKIYIDVEILVSRIFKNFPKKHVKIRIDVFQNVVKTENSQIEIFSRLS